MKGMCFFLAALGLVAASASDAAERNCDGAIVWETTGGSVSGTLDQFTGTGRCGDTVPNRCRTRARAAIESCARTHWERRWTHYPTDNQGAPTPDYDRDPPEACTSGAGITGYTMRKRCEKHPTDESRVCNNEGLGQHVRAGRQFVEVSKAGNIKDALEASVCCFRRHGLEGPGDYPNPSKVHVRLKVLASNSAQSQHCRLNVELEDDYEINCSRVRETLCRSN